MKNKSFAKSLKNALCGILTVFRTERNMRFHFMIGNLIALFAYFYKISRAEWAVLMLTIMFVISAEMINTAVEKAVDTATEEYSENARIAKDAAAGGVLISAVSAIITGFCIFFDTERITDTLIYIFTTPSALACGLILGIADLVFLIFGGKTTKKERE